jgi:hypothetical protein
MLNMKKIEEESKGSTSEEEPEYESDTHSAKSEKAPSKSTRPKITPYLSTNLITERNLTLADVSVEDYSVERIEDMKYDLIDMIVQIKWVPLLIDPKSEMKA